MTNKPHGIEVSHTLYSSRKNNCQKIYPAHSVIIKRDSILRGSCFCENYTCCDAGNSNCRIEDYNNATTCHTFTK